MTPVFCKPLARTFATTFTWLLLLWHPQWTNSAITQTQSRTSVFDMPETCFYELTVSYITGFPDGVRKTIMGVNGQFPGPEIRCTKGSWLHVRVHNHLNESTSIHWHGIEQNLSPFYDGPEMVSQCPIIPGTSMDYVFELDQAGTYWYHSHHSYQYVDGLWGVLIVDNGPNGEGEVWRDTYFPGDELTFTVNDWHHTPGSILSHQYLYEGFGIPVPDSGLINGRGRFNCDPSNPDCDRDEQFPSVKVVNPCRRYRVRIINTSARTNFNFSIDGHQMRVIEVDGVDTVMSNPVGVLTIWPAQRYSVLVSMDGGVSVGGDGTADLFTINAGMNTIENGAVAFLQYSMSASSAGCGLGITIAQSMAVANEDAEEGRPVTHSPPTNDEVARRERIADTIKKCRPPVSESVSSISAAASVPAVQVAHVPMNPAAAPPPSAPRQLYKPPANSPALVNLDPTVCVPFHSRGSPSPPTYFDQEFVLNITSCTAENGKRRAMCVNGSPYDPTKTPRPALLQVIRGEPVSPTLNPYPVPTYGTVVQLIINNFNAAHPWHLHGHTFWVLGTGGPTDGAYDRARDERKLNVTNAVRRDTTHALANSWVVVRYVADNPGAWLLHCHINWHLEAGLGVVFVESARQVQQLYRVPDDWLEVCRRAGMV